jgi:hypothetical protein
MPSFADPVAVRRSSCSSRARESTYQSGCVSAYRRGVRGQPNTFRHNWIAHTVATPASELTCPVFPGTEPFIGCTRLAVPRPRPHALRSHV